MLEPPDDLAAGTKRAGRASEQACFGRAMRFSSAYWVGMLSTTSQAHGHHDHCAQMGAVSRIARPYSNKGESRAHPPQPILKSKSPRSRATKARRWRRSTLRRRSNMSQNSAVDDTRRSFPEELERSSLFGASAKTRTQNCPETRLPLSPSSGRQT